MSRPKKEEAQAPHAPPAPQKQRPEALVECPPAHLVCPRCAGNKRVMDFRSGDRATGESAGWKAIECPGCGGAGNVDEKTAVAILARMEQNTLA